MAWRPELTAVTVILDAAPDGFETAAQVDPRALGALLADQAGIEGRHVIFADAAGEQRWIVQADGSVIGGFRRDFGAGYARGEGSLPVTDGTSNT